MFDNLMLQEAERVNFDAYAKVYAKCIGLDKYGNFLGIDSAGTRSELEFLMMETGYDYVPTESQPVNEFFLVFE